jgi:hypothetical protein
MTVSAVLSSDALFEINTYLQGCVVSFSMNRKTEKVKQSKFIILMVKNAGT